MSYKDIVNTPEEIAREFGPVYDYLPPPPKPGIRKLCGVPEDQYVVRHLDDNIPNFSPHLHPEYNNPLCNGAIKYEGFGNGMNTDFLMKLVIFIIIIGMIIYFAKHL